MIKTKILKIKGDWKEVLNDCRFTVNKNEIDKEPSDDFKRRILIAEHSPIRNISFKWEWLGIYHWVVVHWVRHKFEKYVATQRTDRTGIDRHSLSQDAPSDMRGDANTQHLIDAMKRRLCFKASPETRECAESLKIEIKEYDEHISNVFVPYCIHSGGCREHRYYDEDRCKFYEVFLDWCEKNQIEIHDVQDRYDAYNKYFYERINEANDKG